MKKENKIIMKYNFNFNRINSFFINLISATVPYSDENIIYNSIPIFFDSRMKKLRGDLHGY